MDQWMSSGSTLQKYYYRTQGGYAFHMLERDAPLVAVRGLLGITVTYQGSPALGFTTIPFDVVVCKQCWDEWVSTPPWNDTPPTIKVPPTCRHLEVESEDVEIE